MAQSDSCTEIGVVHPRFMKDIAIQYEGLYIHYSLKGHDVISVDQDDVHVLAWIKRRISADRRGILEGRLSLLRDEYYHRKRMGTWSLNEPSESE